jgi:AraC-like DNA-binding protein
MDNEKYLELKEKVVHGDFKLPMEIYTGEFRNNFDLYLHWHKEMEFIYINSGKGELYLDLNFYEVEEGDFILIKKGAIHYVIGDRVCILKYQAMVFDLDLLQNPLLDFCQLNFIEPILKDELHLIPIIKKDNKGYEDILDCFNKITNSYYRKGFGFQLEIKGLFFLIFFKIFSNGYAEKASENIPQKNMKLDKIKEVISYIQTHYNEAISIKKLAEIAEYSEYHFIRFFKLQTGRTCVEFINLLRVEKAANLLVTTKNSVTDIAYDVGFGDVSYFIKIFKKYFKVSPREFRKNHLT